MHIHVLGTPKNIVKYVHKVHEIFSEILPRENFPKIYLPS